MSAKLVSWFMIVNNVLAIRLLAGWSCEADYYGILLTAIFASLAGMAAAHLAYTYLGPKQPTR